MAKFGVEIMPKKEVLDVAGRAVEGILELNGYPKVGIRVGKFVEIEVTEQDLNKARAQAENVARDFLHNPLIEEFNVIEVES